MGLTEYIKIYDLDQTICSEVYDFIISPKIEWTGHYFEYGSSKREENPENILCSYPYEIMPSKLREDLEKILWDNAFHYIKNFKYDVGIKYLTLPRFNKYNVGSYMSPHVDHIHSLFDGEKRGIPILTILVLYTANFSGGQLFVCDENINLKKNQMVIFPSIFLYPHYVTKVETGERISSSSWIF